ncbi:TPA: recombinase family protein [Corynebacterium aurimucosum]|nr:recombinase family protein [Corynebacterium aurimucosum]
MAKTVTHILATKHLHQAKARPGTLRKRRVAAYARVSTDTDEQASSCEAQISYYTTHIRSREDWVFAGMYSDEGISGTSTKHREGFQRMIADALGGKIDLILTKRVSRFARNTVDSLTTVRQLKDAGVEVYFEKENIYTFDSKGELLITIMSSLAQEESRSISENVTWGHRRRFAEGKALISYKNLLGYTKNSDGDLVIDETEAPIVRRIYANYLARHTPSQIATDLTRDEVPTPQGKQVWSVSTINSILRNEKYKGDVLIQKTFTIDFLTKKTKKNEGEVPQYYVSGHHEPIIDPAVWERVQQEIRHRSGHYVSRPHPFTKMIYCAQCGGVFGRKTWHAGTKYSRRIWRCNNKYSTGHAPCATPHVTDTDIREAFVAALAARIDAHAGARAAFELLEQTAFNTSDLEVQRDHATQQLHEVTVLIDQLLLTAAHTPIDPDEYDRRYAELEARYTTAATRHADLDTQISDKKAKLEHARAICDFIDTNPPLAYSDDAWALLVERATVAEDGTITLCFKDEVGDYQP